MGMKYDPAAGASRLTQRLPAFLADLRKLVNIDSGTHDKSGIDTVLSHLATRYQQLGAGIRIIPHDRLGNTMVATFSGEGSGSMLLIGHTDTVYPPGTAASSPFRIEGDRAYGPGTTDMKAGDLAIVYALEDLLGQGWKDFSTVTVVHNSDEEIGSPSSRELIHQESLQADAVLVLEPGRENGDIVSARKGIVDMEIEVRGQSAHAGVNKSRGRSAALEMAHLIVALESLNSQPGEVSVNVGRVESGDRVNVVPDRAHAHVEMRATTKAMLDEALSRIEKVVATRTVDGTSAVLRSSVEHLPMQRTASTAHLVDLARRVASEIGFEVNDTATGGASDGNTAAQAGRPVLDGLGPIGGLAHSPEEYVLVPSIAPRVALLAGIMVLIGAGAIEEASP